jgi:hypothetical protein
MGPVSQFLLRISSYQGASLLGIVVLPASLAEVGTTKAEDDCASRKPLVTIALREEICSRGEISYCSGLFRLCTTGTISNTR